jgi:hypothetical protein
MTGATNDISYTTGTYTANSLVAIADAIAGKLGMTADDNVVNSVTAYATADPSTTTFNANKDLTEFALSNLKITWAWAFDEQDDAADTVLGLLENVTNTVVKLGANGDYVEVAEHTDYCLDIQFDLEITVSQTN